MNWKMMGIAVAIMLMLPAPRYWIEHDGGWLAWAVFTWLAMLAGVMWCKGTQAL